MTTHWFGSPFTDAGLSDISLMGTGPDEAERNLLMLQRVRDGLLREPAKNSSDDGEDTAA